MSPKRICASLHSRRPFLPELFQSVFTVLTWIKHRRLSTINPPTQTRRRLTGTPFGFSALLLLLAGTVIPVSASFLGLFDAPVMLTAASTLATVVLGLIGCRKDARRAPGAFAALVGAAFLVLMGIGVLASLVVLSGH